MTLNVLVNNQLQPSLSTHFQFTDVVGKHGALGQGKRFLVGVGE